MIVGYEARAPVARHGHTTGAYDYLCAGRRQRDLTLVRIKSGGFLCRRTAIYVVILNFLSGVDAYDDGAVCFLL